MNNCLLWKSILEKKPNQKLMYIHTPKCGGTYVKQILKDLEIDYKDGHVLANKNEGINFTIIRDPVERFESLLNFRLSTLQNSFIKRLQYVYKNETLSLNDIVGLMTDDEILGFKPYRSLSYWSQNVDILITIDQLPQFLQCSGYKYNPNNYDKTNVSKKLRGTFSNETRERIRKLYYPDVLLFNMVTRSIT